MQQMGGYTRSRMAGPLRLLGTPLREAPGSASVGILVSWDDFASETSTVVDFCPFHESFSFEETDDQLLENMTRELHTTMRSLPGGLRPAGIWFVDGAQTSAETVIEYIWKCISLSNVLMSERRELSFTEEKENNAENVSQQFPLHYVIHFAHDYALHQAYDVKQSKESTVLCHVNTEQITRLPDVWPLSLCRFLCPLRVSLILEILPSNVPSLNKPTSELQLQTLLRRAFAKDTYDLMAQPPILIGCPLEVTSTESGRSKLSTATSHASEGPPPASLNPKQFAILRDAKSTYLSVAESATAVSQASETLVVLCSGLLSSSQMFMLSQASVEQKKTADQAETFANDTRCPKRKTIFAEIDVDIVAVCYASVRTPLHHVFKMLEEDAIRALALRILAGFDTSQVSLSSCRALKRNFISIVCPERAHILGSRGASCLLGNWWPRRSTSSVATYVSPSRHILDEKTWCKVALEFFESPHVEQHHIKFKASPTPNLFPPQAGRLPFTTLWPAPGSTLLLLLCLSVISVCVVSILLRHD